MKQNASIWMIYKWRMNGNWEYSFGLCIDDKNHNCMYSFGLCTNDKNDNWMYSFGLCTNDENDNWMYPSGLCTNDIWMTIACVDLDSILVMYKSQLNANHWDDAKMVHKLPLNIFFEMV